ncbi:Na+/H+ antiporter NhaA [Luteibacter yeojuensis]
MMRKLIWSPLRRLQDFLNGSAAGGLVLMGASAIALVIANSPAQEGYFSLLHASFGGMSVLHWINDGLMSVFFLLVGLEIKRELLDGELKTNRLRVLPGLAALGGMVVPAAIYVLLNHGDPEALKGWAVPSATDIAFALGVAALLGSRVPPSLKAFLAALAIIDDLGAVIIIAIFYTSGIALAYLALAGGILVALAAMNRWGVRSLWPYLVFGALLWIAVLRSGVHATLAGVALAMFIPIKDATGRLPSNGDCTHSPLAALEHALHRVVPFSIVPLFGFANAGVSFGGMGWEEWIAGTTLGVAFGLAAGKVIGIFGFSALAIRGGIASMPSGATWRELLATSLLCGIGFTMSLFIGMLAFADRADLQNEVKLGILVGSLVAGVAGWLVFLGGKRKNDEDGAPSIAMVP